MGLAVAEELFRSAWNIAIVDLNETQAQQALLRLGTSAIFVRADVTKYDQQLAAFQKTKDTYGQIDFVFANAGIIGKADFYDKPEQWPPKPPSLLIQEICLTGVIYTSHLAMHFMRQNATAGGVLVMTASGQYSMHYTGLDLIVNSVLALRHAGSPTLCVVQARGAGAHAVHERQARR